jgi:hypothetical protein
MKKVFICHVVAIVVFILMFDLGLVVAKSPPKTGGVLPEINLPAPKDLGQRNYLGLLGGGLFKIPQIKADAVIIEIFSMY